MMEFTQQEMHDAMEEMGYKNWTLRQMATLRSKGYLPKLIPKRKPGTNKAMYVWTEAEIDHIFTVYSLFEEYPGNYDRVAIALWLKGYNIPPKLLRRTFLRPVEKYFQRLTKGETDVDEISIAVSSIALKFINTMRFTPSLVTQRKKVSIEQMKLFTQILLDILSGLEPDTEMLNSLFNSDDEEFFVYAQQIIVVVRDILAFPQLREAINTASIEQWQKAREDFLSICNIFGIIEERRPRPKNDEDPFPEDFLMGLKIMGALWLTAPLLSMRYRGYGKWIDKAIEDIHEFLADPAIQEHILNKYKARRIIEADVQDGQKPELSIPE